MARAALLLAGFAALSAWAGAQGPAPPSAADRVRMLRADRNLIENLVGDGVALAGADAPLARAEACRRTARTLANSVERATDDRNPDRVAELAGLMAVVVADGLLPNLDEAGRTIPPGSPDEKLLGALREKAAADLDAVARGVPAGPVGDHPGVQHALKRLAELRTKFK